MHPTDPAVDDGLNRDPLTGATGSHPLGAGVGAALGGAAAGAVIGTGAGPVGTVIGAAIGAIAGGYAGKTFAEAIDPTVEETYWRENFKDRPYASSGSGYEDYGPAYRYGIDSFKQYPGRQFDDIENELAHGWQAARANSSLEWDRAQPATRDSWNRLNSSLVRRAGSDATHDAK
jgi:hypothetical protein